jgi:hypothetical protein
MLWRAELSRPGSNTRNRGNILIQLWLTCANDLNWLGASCHSHIGRAAPSIRPDIIFGKDKAWSTCRAGSFDDYLELGKLPNNIWQ